MIKKAIRTLLIIATAISFYSIGYIQARSEMIVEIPDYYLDTTTYEFFNNYIDMREVVDFKAIETELYLYTSDGSEYSWSR